MGILDWLRHAVHDEKTDVAHPPLHFDKHEEEFHGLNMRLALDAHLKWKERLEQAIGKSSAEDLEVGVVGADDRCTLGHWLHGEARRLFSKHPEYDQLVKAHADFHLMAGDVVCDVHDGRNAEARVKLTRDFRQKSDRVQLALVRLYAKARV